MKTRHNQVKINRLLGHIEVTKEEVEILKAKKSKDNIVCANIDHMERAIRRREQAIEWLKEQKEDVKWVDIMNKFKIKHWFYQAKKKDI